MSIKEEIDELIEAKLKEHGLIGGKKESSGGGKKAGSKKAPETTIEDVRAALSELIEKKGKDAAKKILKSVGAEKLGDVEESDFAAVKEKAEKALEEGDDDLGLD